MLSRLRHRGVAGTGTRRSGNRRCRPGRTAAPHDRTAPPHRCPARRGGSSRARRAARSLEGGQPQEPREPAPGGQGGEPWHRQDGAFRRAGAQPVEHGVLEGERAVHPQQRHRRRGVGELAGGVHALRALRVEHRAQRRRRAAVGPGLLAEYLPHLRRSEGEGGGGAERGRRGAGCGDAEMRGPPPVRARHGRVQQ